MKEQLLVLIFIKHFQPAGAHGCTAGIHKPYHNELLFSFLTRHVEFVQLKIIV